MSNFLYDAYVILGKIYTEKTYIKQAISSVQTDPANKALTVKIVYGVIENDMYLDWIIRQNTEKSPKQAVKIILKESLYLIKFANKPVYAVTNEAVSLAKKLGKGGVSGFINAFLRKASQAELTLPADFVKMLSLKYSYPEFAVKMLVSAYGKETAEKIASYRSDLQTIRFSKKHISEQNSYQNLQKTSFDNVFQTKGLLMDDAFFEGKYTFQSIGSVAVCDIIEPCEKILDACAAPGGKSVYLSEKCGEVTAFELHPHRLELILSYARRMGAANVSATVKDSSVYDEAYKDSFDAVLCDVPCSGFGVAHQNPDIKLGKTASDIDALNKIQLNILSTCAKYVKSGGYLYYSTCSVFPQENDNIVTKFLKENEGFEVCAFQSRLSNLKKQNGLQFLPHISMGAGFYVSKIRKK